MTFDEMLLQRVLELPASAIPYAVGRELAALAAPRFVLELPGNAIDVWALADAGRCTTQPREGIHSQTGATWSKRGKLKDSQGTSWLRVQWQGNDLEAVMVCWSNGYDRKVSNWIIAENEATARGFATELADHSTFPDGAFQVFAHGCWSSDVASFAAVRAARTEDLIELVALAAQRKAPAAASAQQTESAG